MPLITTLAVVGGLVVSPATTASALSIDCAYTPGLGDYAARNGLDCQVGTRGGFISTAGPGGFSSAFMPGGAVAPGTMSSYCVNEAPSMPEELYARGTVTAESYSYANGTASTYYYRDGKFFAQRDIFDLNGDGDTGGRDTITIRDFSLGGGLMVKWQLDCLNRTGWLQSLIDTNNVDVDEYVVGPTPTSTPGPTPTAPTSTPPAHSSEPPVSSASLTPVAGATNEFTYSVELKNTHAFARPMSLEVDESAFTVTKVAAMPPGGSCPSASGLALRCVVDPMAANSSGVFTFLVTAKPTPNSSADLVSIASVHGLVGSHAVGASYNLSHGRVSPFNGSMETTSFISPGHAPAAGADVTYGVTLRATSAGTPTVKLSVNGLANASEAAVPAGWVRSGSLDGTTITYKGSFMNVGDIRSLSLHFTLSGLSNTASVLSSVNDAPAKTDTVTIQPDSPVCTGSAVVQNRAALVQLDSLSCSVAAGSRLSDVYHPEAHGQLTVKPSGALFYRAKDASYSGDDKAYVVAVDSAGRRSAPTEIAVTIAPPATAIADEFTVTSGGSLNVAGSGAGLTANDVFPAGREGWLVEAGNPPANGDVQVNADGSIRYTPHVGFHGDDTFRYRLGGPQGAHSDPVTVTVHVQ